MNAPLLSISRRLRHTPFTRRVTEAGVKAYTVYNHMLLPTVFESVEADYHHLKEHVQIWDVACERQKHMIIDSVGFNPGLCDAACKRCVAQAARNRKQGSVHAETSYPKLYK